MQTLNNPIVLAPKPQKAVRLLLVVLLAVLILLYIQTSRNTGTQYNLCLNGDSETIGAEVIIDGQKVGVMTNTAGSGIGGSTFWTHVPDGKHEITVMKTGFDPFVKQMKMHGQGFLGVELKTQEKKEKGDNSKSDENLGF